MAEWKFARQAKETHRQATMAAKEAAEAQEAAELAMKEKGDVDKAEEILTTLTEKLEATQKEQRYLKSTIEQETGTVDIVGSSTMNGL